MASYTYPVVVRPDDHETFLVSFPDFPEAHTFGETKAEALERAADALATAIDGYIKDRRPIPKPSRVTKDCVSLPPLMVSKVALYESMLEQKVGKAELGRRLKWHLPQVDRLVDVHHSSRLDQLESAFNALGKRLVISVEDVERRMIRAALARGSSNQELGRRVAGGPRKHRSAHRVATPRAFANKKR